MNRVLERLRAQAQAAFRESTVTAYLLVRLPSPGPSSGPGALFPAYFPDTGPRGPASRLAPAQHQAPSPPPPLVGSTPQAQETAKVEHSVPPSPHSPSDTSDCKGSLHPSLSSPPRGWVDPHSQNRACPVADGSRPVPGDASPRPSCTLPLGALDPARAPPQNSNTQAQTADASDLPLPDDRSQSPAPASPSSPPTSASPPPRALGTASAFSHPSSGPPAQEVVEADDPESPRPRRSSSSQSSSDHSTSSSPPSQDSLLQDERIGLAALDSSLQEESQAQSQKATFRWSNTGPLPAALNRLCELYRRGRPDWPAKLAGRIGKLRHRPRSLSGATIGRKIRDFQLGGAYGGSQRTSDSPHPTSLPATPTVSDLNSPASPEGGGVTNCRKRLRWKSDSPPEAAAPGRRKPAKKRPKQEAPSTEGHDPPRQTHPPVALDSPLRRKREKSDSPESQSPPGARHKGPGQAAPRDVVCLRCQGRLCVTVACPQARAHATWGVDIGSWLCHSCGLTSSRAVACYTCAPCGLNSCLRCLRDGVE
jgi:hypothetical protein